MRIFFQKKDTFLGRNLDEAVAKYLKLIAPAKKKLIFRLRHMRN